MTEIEIFRDKVESFIAKKEMTPTQFGKTFAGDPLFVFQLREGREPRSQTRQRITAAMEAAQTEVPAL
ncbi:hypothetical protein ACQZ4Z_12905 [Agrobacterium vitis]|uniref:hypothetical protein n=1 Tax=Agrobacterium vitis TaxID=373 RepID=UPI001572CE5A|nr:hypothetical protein [Agrobacterium vitis]NSZ42814.1 hypothetical protein [Agrobacterium vitis]